MTNTELKLEKALTELENIVLKMQVEVLSNKEIDYTDIDLSEVLDEYGPAEILDYFSEDEIKEYVSDNYYPEDWVEAEEVQFSWNY